MIDGITHDGKTNEWFFSDDIYIISETDEKGIILYANNVFAEMAGYTLDELIGLPHNIIRHPDMPRAAFKMVWDSIQTKGYWRGYVKNKRKDGGFYWVLAMILRKIDHNGYITYLSVRTNPNKAKVAEAAALYATLH
jgi:PAS domain S-box-containing protein